MILELAFKVGKIYLSSPDIWLILLFEPLHAILLRGFSQGDANFSRLFSYLVNAFTFTVELF